jgi:hypothetical protein
MSYIELMRVTGCHVDQARQAILANLIAGPCESVGIRERAAEPIPQAIWASAHVKEDDCHIGTLYRGQFLVDFRRSTILAWNGAHYAARFTEVRVPDTLQKRLEDELKRVEREIIAIENDAGFLKQAGSPAAEVREAEPPPLGTQKRLARKIIQEHKQERERAGRVPNINQACELVRQQCPKINRVQARALYREETGRNADHRGKRSVIGTTTS